MCYITADSGATIGLIIVCFFIVGIGIEIITMILFHKSFVFSGGLVFGAIKGCLLIFLAVMLSCGIDEAYAAFINPHHLHLTDKIEGYNPYIGHHYIPLNDDCYCTPEGDRITKEESLRLFHETHDLVFDLEGHVIDTPPKGEAPETGRDIDSPYYVFNMSDEQRDAYYSAKGIVDTKKIISKAKLFNKLTDPYDSYQYSSEAVSFALEALEENELVDWVGFCTEEAENTYFFMSYMTRDDMFKYLTEDQEYTAEEAETAVNEVYDSE